MKSRSRLVYYLLINIFVSALATGTVIFFYDRAHRADCVPALQDAATLLPGNDEINVNILGVIGVGTLTDERMVIQNNGTQELVLTGWYLADNQGLAYAFPQVTLYPGVKLQVHTTSGKNSPSDLFWGRSAPVWTSGELAALYDTQNIVRAFYRVP
jgi:hypothetical protein